MTDIMSAPNGRTELDILTRAGYSLTLGFEVFKVRPLSMNHRAKWMETVEQAIGEKFTSVEEIENIAAVLGYLGQFSEMLLDLVIAYDELGTLPAKDWLLENATDEEVKEALIFLVVKANPLVDVANEFLPGEVRSIVMTRLMMAVLTSVSAQPTNAPSPPGATKLRKRSATS